ncbi:MAG: HAD-IC family P-type ATPase [Candidatus Limnocylindria bacterium]
MAALRSQGVERVVMLTGDNAGTAAAIAGAVGMDDHAAALMPEGKVEEILKLKDRYGTVAMVGDGINDAPALATASVGIAMGTGGSDAAIAAADVALVADDLEKLRLAFHIGRQSSRLIRQNIVASLAIVIVLVVATFAADLSMFAAVIGHEGSEVLIILNGLRVARAAV